MKSVFCLAFPVLFVSCAFLPCKKLLFVFVAFANQTTSRTFEKVAFYLITLKQGESYHNASKPFTRYHFNTPPRKHKLLSSHDLLSFCTSFSRYKALNIVATTQPSHKIQGGNGKMQQIDAVSYTKKFAKIFGFSRSLRNSVKKSNCSSLKTIIAMIVAFSLCHERDIINFF